MGGKSFHLFDEPSFLLIFVLGHWELHEIIVGEPFVELRFVAVEHFHFVIDTIVNGDGDVRLEWNGFDEGILHVHDDGHVMKVGGIGADRWDGEQVRSIQDELGGVAVVGVVIPGAVSDDEVGLEFSYEGDELVADFLGRLQPGIRVVEDLGLSTGNFGGGLGFGSTAPGELRAVD